MVLSSILSSFASVGFTVIGIALLIFVVLKIGGLMTKIIVGFIMNVLLGLILLYIATSVMGITFSYSVPELVSIALFGLPGVGTMILLKLGGVSALAIL